MKQVLDYVKELLKSLGFMLLPLLVVLAFSLIVVFPIWFFADKFPKQYTFVVLVFFAIISVFFLIRKMYRSLKANREKFLRNLFKLFICVLFFSLAIFALFNINRLVALLFFLVPFAIFLVLGIFKPVKTEKSSA